MSKELVVKFSKPVTFENETHEEIDLSNLENITASDLSDVESQVMDSIVPELTMKYALLLAAKATKKPVELFNSLPAKEGLKVKRMVTNFLNN